MPLVLIHKAERVWKDRQKKAGRDANAIRTANRIADEHVDQFSRAFLEVQRNLIDDDTAARLRSVLRDSTSIEEALSAIPWYVEGEDSEFWQKIINRISRAYAEVLSAAGDHEAHSINSKLRVKGKVKFTMDPGQPVDVSKAKQKKPQAGIGVEVKPVVPIAPVNPWAQEWIKTAAAKLITQYITRDQKQMIRELLLDAFSKGQRAETIVENIRQRIGLTVRWARAVDNRYMLLKYLGYDTETALKETAAYAEQLRRKRAIMISRTETIAAQAEGRNEMWRLAQESGSLPPVERVWVAIPSFGPSGRTCEICEDLDGTAADIGEAYKVQTSLSDDMILMPPAHPHCRCTEILREKTT